MARRVLFAAAIIGICAAALVVWRPWRDTSPAASARRACDLMDEFRVDVAADARSDRVFPTLDAARRAANDAASRDGRWLPLSSGIEAVQVAFDNDDPGAARVGIEVVASNCRTAGAPFRRPTR